MQILLTLIVCRQFQMWPYNLTLCNLNHYNFSWALIFILLPIHSRIMPSCSFCHGLVMLRNWNPICYHESVFHLSSSFVFRIMCLWMWSHLSSTELWMNMPRMLSINFQGHKHRSKLMSLMVWFYLWKFENLPFLFPGSKKSVGTYVKDTFFTLSKKGMINEKGLHRRI